MSAPHSQAPMLGVTAIKPVERHGFEAVKFFCWNPTERAIMGRTPKSWLLITVFYIIYYAFLAAFWSLMMYIFFLTIDENKPKWEGDNGLIGTSPGLGLRPSQPDSRLDSSMIIFDKDSENGTDDIPGTALWKESINKFLSRNYHHHDGVPCLNGKPSEDPKKACKFSVSSLGKCQNPDTAFGYAEGKPCIYLKLNRIFGVPNEYYESEEDFPEDMPDELKRHIKRQPKPWNKTWISCAGENPADRESLGKISYYPKERGLGSEYFPYEGQYHYMSPLVAVQFENPAVGQLLHVECRAWAKNIEYHRMNRKGMVHLELFVLDKKTVVEYRKSVE